LKRLNQVEIRLAYKKYYCDKIDAIVLFIIILHVMILWIRLI